MGPHVCLCEFPGGEETQYNLSHGAGIRYRGEHFVILQSPLLYLKCSPISRWRPNHASVVNYDISVYYTYVMKLIFHRAANHLRSLFLHLPPLLHHSLPSVVQWSSYWNFHFLLGLLTQNVILATCHWIISGILNSARYSQIGLNWVTYGLFNSIRWNTALFPASILSILSVELYVIDLF